MCAYKHGYIRLPHKRGTNAQKVFEASSDLALLMQVGAVHDRELFDSMMEHPILIWFVQHRAEFSRFSN